MDCRPYPYIRKNGVLVANWQGWQYDALHTERQKMGVEMKQSRVIGLIILFSLLISACSIQPTAIATPTPTATLAAPTATAFLPEDTATPTATATPEPTATPTPLYPPEGMGPSEFPADVDPLTGLKVSDPSLLNRRPIMIKIENLPRTGRPQHGLSNADMVFEYYSEQGTTRFAALYYGQDSAEVRPIRSARMVDITLMRAYKPVLLYGSASYQVRDRLGPEFGDRLILESAGSCPAICRGSEKGNSYLVSDTSAVRGLLEKRGVDNSRQNLNGMFFKLEPPTDAQPGEQVFVRFSGAIYNRWDYDAASGKYLRSSDAANDLSGSNPVYEQLTDANTKQPIAFDNVLVLFARYTDIDPRPEVEIMEVNLQGAGPAYLARDGKVVPARWQRLAETDIISLVDDNGNPVAFKPGQTWVEVLTANTSFTQEGAAFHFTLISDWK